MRNSRCNGVDVFEDGGEFSSKDIVAGLDPDETGFQSLRQPIGVLFCRAGHRQVAELFACHFLGMTRTADDANVLVGCPKAFVQVPSRDAVVLRHHSFDRREENLLLHPLDVSLAEYAVQMQTRNDHHQHIASIHHRLHVRGDVQFVLRKADALDVARIVTIRHQLIRRLLAAHPPMQGVNIVAQHLRDGCGPTSAAEDADVHGRKCNRNKSWGLQTSAYLRARMRAASTGSNLNFEHTKP